MILVNKYIPQLIKLFVFFYCDPMRNFGHGAGITPSIVRSQGGCYNNWRLLYIYRGGVLIKTLQ